MAVAESHDPQEFLRERVAFVIRLMTRAQMGSEFKPGTDSRVCVERWIELLQKALDGEPLA